MDLRDLRYVREVAEHGNFSRAAEALGLTQPALTRRVQAVEAELGVELFRRHAKGVDLTSSGEFVVKRAEELLQGVENIKAEIDRQRGRDVGEVNVGAGPVVAQTIVGEAIAELIKSRPGIRVSAYVGSVQELVEWLQQGKTELYISDVSAIEKDPDIEVMHKFDHVGYFFCRSGHPILARKNPSVKEILSYPFATAHLPPTVARHFQNSLGSRRFVPTIECDSYPILQTVVANSDAISIASRYAIIDGLVSGRLVEVPTKGPAVVTALGVARRARRQLSPAAQALADLLFERIDRILSLSVKGLAGTLLGRKSPTSGRKGRAQK